MPTSTQTSTGRLAPVPRVGTPSGSTPRCESTQHISLKSGSASQLRGDPPQAGRVDQLVGEDEITHTERAVDAAWLMVATVTADAPASNWRANSCGAMWVLPCGASSTPRSRHHPAIVVRLCVSACARSTHSGPTAPSSIRFGAAAQICAGVRPHHEAGSPLNRQSSGSSAKAATAAALMGAVMSSFKLATS